MKTKLLVISIVLMVMSIPVCQLNASAAEGWVTQQWYEVNSTYMQSMKKTMLYSTWSDVHDAHTSDGDIYNYSWIEVTTDDAPITQATIYRTFIYWNASTLPINGMIYQAYFILNCTDEAGPEPKRLVAVMNGSADTDKPNRTAMQLSDFWFENYDLSTSISYGNESLAERSVNFTVNATGRELMSDNFNRTTEPGAGVVLMHEWDYEDAAPDSAQNFTKTSGAEGYGYITIWLLMDGYQRKSDGGWQPYADFDPGWITSALGTLFWIFGLGGMIVVPMLIVARAKESGELTSRFNNVVVLVGLWVFCLGIFVWALS